MKTKRRVIDITALGLALVVLSVFLVAITLEYNSNMEWLFLMIAILSGGFIAELWKSYQGHKIIWDYLGVRDKVLFFIDLVILLVSTAMPMEKGVSLGLRFLSFLIGYMVVWIITYYFGSEIAKEKLLWPKP